MQAACICLLEQQKKLFANEDDREILFYLWLDKNFCGGRLSCVVPQVRISDYNYTASGIIIDTSTTDIVANTKWRKLWCSDLQCEQYFEKKLIRCKLTEPGVECVSVQPKKMKIVEEGKKESDSESAFEYLRKSSSVKSTLLNGSWLCVIESKKEEDMLILAQAGGYFYHFVDAEDSDILSNVPMFLIGLSGTCIKFGVGIRSRFWIYVSELRTFSLQSRVTGEEDFREMAAYFLTFRHLMIEAGDARNKLNEVGNYHVDPFSDDSGFEVDDPDVFRFPPKRHFKVDVGSGEKERYVISRIYDEIKLDMFTYMFKGVAERKRSFDTIAVDDSSHEKFDVIIRYDSRCGREAHTQLYEAGFAPRLYAAERCHRDYDDVLFVVMEYLDVETEYECLEDLIAESSRRIISEESKTFMTKDLLALKKTLGEKKVVHGDLRPCNILFGRSSQKLKILDFEFGTDIAGQPTKYPLTVNVAKLEEWGCSNRKAASQLRDLVISHQQDEKMIDYCISRIKSL